MMKKKEKEKEEGEACTGGKFSSWMSPEVSNSLSLRRMTTRTHEQAILRHILLVPAADGPRLTSGSGSG